MGRTLSSPYVDLEDILEPVIAKIKEELEETELFDDVSEGESHYDGVGTVAWVVPGTDPITHFGTTTLEHRATIYVIILNTSTEATLSELRAIGQQAYNKLMEDITHGGTCFSCLPRLWHPGFLQFGEVTYCGVLMSWEARVHQTFALPP